MSLADEAAELGAGDKAREVRGGDTTEGCGERVGQGRRFVNIISESGDDAFGVGLILSCLIELVGRHARVLGERGR